MYTSLYTLQYIFNVSIDIMQLCVCVSWWSLNYSNAYGRIKKHLSKFFWSLMGRTNMLGGYEHIIMGMIDGK